MILVGLRAALGPRLHIQEVVVTGSSEELSGEVKALSREYLDERRWFLFKRAHPWAFSQQKLEAHLVETLPLSGVTAEREGVQLTIQVREKIRRFYVIKDDQMYAVDRDGVYMEDVDDLDRIRIVLEREAGSGPPLIHDKRVATSHGKDVPGEVLEDVVRIFQYIQAETMLTAVSTTILDEPGRVDVLTDAGPTLYMTTNRPIDAQIGKLRALIDRKLVDVQSLSYIDLRFESRLYYH